MEHLKKRGFQLASRCPLCGKAEEELNHLLIHCLSIWGLWEGLISIVGLEWVCLSRLRTCFWAGPFSP